MPCLKQIMLPRHIEEIEDLVYKTGVNEVLKEMQSCLEIFGTHLDQEDYAALRLDIERFKRQKNPSVYLVTDLMLSLAVILNVRINEFVNDEELEND